MQTVWAESVLTIDGWRRNVRIEIGIDGRISAVTPDVPSSGNAGFDTIVPAPVNLHSHAFQRAMAGLTEARGPQDTDSFWTWRKLMYRFLDNLNPTDVETITAFVQMEMLEAGYGGVCEFHYLHHQSDGTRYDNPAELSHRVAAASEQTGIGLTLLPVFYQYGGCDKRPLGAGQIRFGTDLDEFGRLFDGAKTALRGLPADTAIGVAPHSLRAVSPKGLSACAALAPGAPLHMHLAEQVLEVDEVVDALGARPVDWLLGAHDLGPRWCLIHVTQMRPEETTKLARTGAVAGLCPITESNLGDGIFDGMRFVAEGGCFGVGSDSNIRISLSEELRTLEYSQRLRDRGRAMFATQSRSTGRMLLDMVASGGARAAGRDAGAIAPGKLADLVALDASSPDLVGKSKDTLLDGYIFAGDDRIVKDVWSAGRHVVRDGFHIRHDAITSAYRKTLTQLMDRM